MTQQEETLLKFPCEFPIKAFGKSSEDFEKAVLEIITRHVDDLAEDALKFNNSSQGKYTSITITVRAKNKQQLDAIYLDLTACEHVVMAL